MKKLSGQNDFALLIEKEARIFFLFSKRLLLVHMESDSEVELEEEARRLMHLGARCHIIAVLSSYEPK